MNQYLVCDWSAIHPMVSAVVLQYTGSVTMSPMCADCCEYHDYGHWLLTCLLRTLHSKLKNFTTSMPDK